MPCTRLLALRNVFNCVRKLGGFLVKFMPYICMCLVFTETALFRSANAFIGNG